MKNFSRVVRLALRYRWTVGASLICAVLVAVMWGGNLGTIYPFVEVAFRGQTLGQWITGEIASAEATETELTQQLAALEAKAANLKNTEPGADLESIRSEQRSLEIRLDAERTALVRFRELEPWILNYLPNNAFLTLCVIIAALVAGTLVKSLFIVVHSVLVGRMTNLALFDLRKQFYRRTLRMHLASFNDAGTSELMSRFTYDMESLGNGLRSLFGKTVREPLKMLACLIGAGCICWRLLLLTMLIAPPAALLIRWLSRMLKRANRRALENMSQVYSILEETLQGIKIVKAFTMERYERRRFHVNSKAFYERAMRIARYDALTHPLTELIGMSMICLALLAGAYLVLNGETHLLGLRMCDRPMSRSSMLLFFGFLAGVSDPARKLSEVFNGLQRAAAASDRIFAMMDRQSLVADPIQPVPFGRHHRDVSFQGVGFSYVPGTQVLEEIDLRIPFGETVAIVGPNGCGKSTLVNMIPRFFDPTLGIVKIDGTDLRQVRLRDLRSQIGIVTQETLLFDDTVFNNIRYGSPGATRQQVIEAAKQAHAHRFIEERLEKGYDTIVGQRGGSLSGGQRQRIALARAILRDPAILILDEATSQIDLESEQLIHKVLEQFTRHRTTLIITHRLSTLALADRILVMDHGHILDFGTHDELLRRCEFYSRLQAVQLRESA